MRNSKSVAMGCGQFFEDMKTVEAWRTNSGYEAKKWQPVRPSHEQVIPSGSLNAQLGLQLHWPSRTTKFLQNAEILDATNPCLNFIMQKRPPYQDAFWFDTFMRRETKEGFKSYTWREYEANRPWVEWVYANMKAKVMLVFGKANRERFYNENHQNFHSLPLWGSWEGVELTIQYTNQHPRAIRRLVLFITHPEFLFYDWSPEAARKMDLRVNAAAELAGLKMGRTTFFRDRNAYYSNKFWWAAPRSHTMIKAKSTKPHREQSSITKAKKAKPSDGLLENIPEGEYRSRRGGKYEALSSVETNANIASAVICSYLQTP
jgi:hypothetical protein